MWEKKLLDRFEAQLKQAECADSDSEQSNMCLIDSYWTGVCVKQSLQEGQAAKQMLEIHFDIYSLSCQDSVYTHTPNQKVN